MPRTTTRPQEVALPAAALGALRRTLAAEFGPDPAARALQEAGCAAGHILFPALGGGEDAARLPLEELVSRMDRLLSARGWGRLHHALPHQGVGELVADGWLEAGSTGSARRPSCFFTTGLLAALLSRAAGGEVAVLEVACHAKGDARCRFLFGAPRTLEAVHRRILKGDDADAALAALG